MYTDDDSVVCDDDSVVCDDDSVVCLVVKGGRNGRVCSMNARLGWFVFISFILRI